MGGIAVILSIIGIFIFLVKEVAPLFFSPQGSQITHFAGAPPTRGLPQSSLVGMDEYQEILYQLSAGLRECYCWGNACKVGGLAPLWRKKQGGYFFY